MGHTIFAHTGKCESPPVLEQYLETDTATMEEEIVTVEDDCAASGTDE